MFFLVGVIYDRAHTRDLNDFGGLAAILPVYAASCCLLQWRLWVCRVWLVVVSEFLVVRGAGLSYAGDGCQHDLDCFSPVLTFSRL